MNRHGRSLRGWLLAAWLGLGSVCGMTATGGDLDSPGAPTAPASEMYTLQAIYDRLASGASGVRSAFAEPLSGPTGGTGRTLDEIMSKAPAVQGNGALTTEVLTGTTFWGLRSGLWGLQTGAMPNIGAQHITPGTTAQPISKGYHDGTGEVAGDDALTSGNIRAGVHIFGIAGAPHVVDTSSGDAAPGDILAGKKAWAGGVEITGTGLIASHPAPVAQTGQTASYAARDDGELERGAAWPNPRFTDNGNGTILDNLTGLIWLKQANYNSTAGDTGTATWANALAFCNALQSGQCGLTDGSSAGDWRLPSIRELQSLIDYGRYNPALPSGHLFSHVQSDGFYWSSTTHANTTSSAWHVYLYRGDVTDDNKSTLLHVWPVRGGQ